MEWQDTSDLTGGGKGSLRKRLIQVKEEGR